MRMAKKNLDYDIGAAFEAVENELMASMIRNMQRHKVEEVDEDKQWTMWQTEMLKSLEQYKKKNHAKYSQKFKDINAQIEALIRVAKDEGEMDQEIQILKAIQKGFPAKKMKAGATAEFFRVNDRKLEALIEATMQDMQKAEMAILRMTNDQYRKIIYNAQVYANTGAGTYEKAVDMATRDFLSAGINCIEYSNGARHTLADYADMAIRTASKRAYLQGEGQKRQEWGVDTVIMNKRGNPCPLCLPWVGKVLIDDVWSGGSKTGKSATTGVKYPLMSTAIAAGLYHPRCRDSHTTYFEGVSTPPDGKYTKEELNELAEKNQQAARQQYAERQEKRFGRLADFSLDPENQKKYEAKREAWHDTVEYMSNSFRPHYGDKQTLRVESIAMDVREVRNSSFDMVTDTENQRNKAARLAEKTFEKIQKDLPETFRLPKIAVVDFEKQGLNANAIGGYHEKTETLYINSRYNTKEKILQFVNRVPGQFANNTEYAPYLHELGHKFYYDSIKRLANAQNISYSEAKKKIDYKVYHYIDSQYDSEYFLMNNISGYADTQEVTEICAECFSVRKENSVALQILKLIGAN